MIVSPGGIGTIVLRDVAKKVMVGIYVRSPY